MCATSPGDEPGRDVRSLCATAGLNLYDFSLIASVEELDELVGDGGGREHAEVGEEHDVARRRVVARRLRARARRRRRAADEGGVDARRLVGGQVSSRAGTSARTCRLGGDVHRLLARGGDDRHLVGPRLRDDAAALDHRLGAAETICDRAIACATAASSMIVTARRRREVLRRRVAVALGVRLGDDHREGVDFAALPAARRRRASGPS